MGFSIRALGDGSVESIITKEDLIDVKMHEG